MIKTICSFIFIFSIFASSSVLAEETEIIKINLKSGSTEALSIAKAIEPTAKKAQFSLVPKVSKPQVNSYVSFQDASKSSKLRDSLFTASLVTSVALNVADYFTTMKGLKNPALQEGNHLMALVVKKPAVFAAVKIGVSALNFYLYKNLYKKNKTLAWISSTVSNLILSYFVTNNLSKINKAQGMQIQ